MFHGDKGKPTKYSVPRIIYDIVIDDERMTLHKLTRSLGFYNVIFDGKIADVETIYDTEKKLLTGAGLHLKKKNTPKRTYFSLVRISSIGDKFTREKKSFLGECDYHDNPSDFPVQIADEINKIFNNLFTINLVDIVKHSTPYIRIEVSGNRYKIVSGTGYEAYIMFENLKIKDLRTGRKAKTRICSLKLELNPDYEIEREHILDSIERHCKELVMLDRNHFEVAEVLVRPPVVKQLTPEEKAEQKKKRKEKKKKEESV